MSVDYRIKEVFKKTGFTLTGYAKMQGKCFQSLSRKINHGRFTVDELIELAHNIGCDLQCCFVLHDGVRLYLHDENWKGEKIMPKDYGMLLYEKVQAEYDDFIADLQGKPAEEIIKKSYEKVIKEEMVSICEFAEMGQKEAKALYLEKYPLDRMYQDWLKSDVSYMDMLRDSVDDTAKEVVAERKEKQRESR